MTAAAIAAPAYAATPQPLLTKTITQRELASVTVVANGEERSVQVELLPRVEAQADPDVGMTDGVSRFSRIHDIRRNGTIDVFDRRVLFANYRYYRLTWSGTWRLKTRLDASGPGLGFVSALCALLWKFPAAGATCAIAFAGSSFVLAHHVNSAIKNHRCFYRARKKLTLIGPRTLQPVLLIGTTRCAR